MAGVVKRRSQNERNEPDNDQTKVPHVKNNQTISNVSIGRDAVIYMNSTNVCCQSLVVIVVSLCMVIIVVLLFINGHFPLKLEDVIPGSIAKEKNANIRRDISRAPLLPTNISEVVNSSKPDIEQRIWIAGDTGTDIVMACIDKLNMLRDLGVFPDDKEFLRRIAYVMSRDGKPPWQLYTDGGIWQVSIYAFQDTFRTDIHGRLRKKYKKIKASLRIDWEKITRVDLEIPIISAVAARLYLSNFAESIPPKYAIKEQADYWWNFYMKDHESKRLMDRNDFIFDVATLNNS